MRILLDECLPHKLGLLLAGHEVRSVKSEGWSGIKNGELLKRAESKGFRVLITVDRNLTYQQNIRQYPLSIIVLAARSNKLPDITPLVDYILEAPPEIKPGEIRLIGV